MVNIKKIITIIIAVYSANLANAQVEDKVYPVPQDTTFKINKINFTDNELMILQNLEAKRIELERKEQVLSVREKLIDLSEDRLHNKISRLEDLESSIKDLVEEVSEKEEKRLQDLAVVYAEMKPALAAERLNILDDITVYGVLKRMNYKKSAKVLEKMNIQKVRVISKMLAEKTLLPELN